MKKKKIRFRIEKAIKAHQLCNLYLEYRRDGYHYFPLKMSDKLIFGAQEEDFQTNGYSIRRMQDIEKVKVEDDFSANISVRESGVHGMEIPEVDISDWMSAFISLEALGKIIIVEKEDLNDKHTMFVIGKIEKVCRKHVCLRYFGPDGIWDDEQWKISYDEITSVTVGSRYAEVFSKYLPEIPGSENVVDTESDENIEVQDAQSEEVLGEEK